MPVHEFRALRADSLLTYLAALGLTRLVAEQTDPTVRTWWVGDHLVMETSLDDVRDFLVEEYCPTPVFSPWNGGSGFGSKDKNQRAVLERIARCDAPRMTTFTEGRRAVDAVMRRASSPGRAEWPKARLLVELRNWLPEAALSWIDAATVVGNEKVYYPSVYGTGGNDGRLEFSSNFHQRLLDVIPELGAKPAASLAWATDALTGAAGVQLKASPAGQFAPVAAGSPGTVSIGSGGSLVNPWHYILMIEACGYLVASVARSAGQPSSRAAVPFTVASSAVGPTAGSADEADRGEFWAPTWTARLSHPEVRQLFRDARASWGGRTPTTSADMYAAVRSHGVDSRVTAFTRFGLVQRNGLAFMATPRDRVDVARRSGIAAAIPVEARERAFVRGTVEGRHALQRRELERRRMAFVTTDDDWASRSHLVEWLAMLTEREHAVALSDKESAGITGVAPQPRAVEMMGLLSPWLDERPEHRVAASLASAWIPDAGGRRRPVRDFLVGQAPRAGEPWFMPVIRGYGVRPLDEVLADLAVWREQHSAPSAGVGRGVRFVSRRAYWCRRGDVNLWVRGQLDRRRLAEGFAACLAVDWTDWPRALRRPVERHAPDLGLAVVSAVNSGAIVLAGFSTDDPDPAARHGWPQGWALRLRSGHAQAVLRDAVSLLERSRLAPPPRRHDDSEPDEGPLARERRAQMAVPLTPAHDPAYGVRLTASLLAPASIGDLARLHLLRDVGEPAYSGGAADPTTTTPVLTVEGDPS